MKSAITSSTRWEIESRKWEFGILVIHSIDASLNSNSCIIHVATNMAQDLGLEAELANGLAVASGLLRGSRRGEFELASQRQL